MKEIAIDGPAGAGKSTLAKALAQKLNYKYLDTGAMYRGCAYYMISNGIDINNITDVSEALNDMHMDVYYTDDGQQHININGTDITPFIRTSEIANGASAVGKNPNVRKKLVEIQRRISKDYNIIMDGRDIGTYVLPNADYKFYLTADIKERAKRRLLENNEEITPSRLSQMASEISARDINDSSREFAPLAKAADAVLIDTTNMTQQQVIDKIISVIQES